MLSLKNRAHLLFILLIISLFASAQDTKSIHLVARFDTINESIDAELRQIIEWPEDGRSWHLNAIGIQVKELLLNGQELPYRQNDTAIFISAQPLSGEVELKIRYSAQPRKGLYFIGWQDSTGRARRQIWTQGQGIDHRHWIPHIDDQRDKMLFSAEWIFNEQYELMSNGHLDSTKSDNGLKHWYYSMDKPMSSYLIALAIDRYKQSEQSLLGVRHQLYHYPERLADSAWYYYKHREIVNFLVEEIDFAYPWTNYKQAPVMDFRHGAMENTSATIFGDFFLVDSLAFNDRNYTYVDAHEFAHQWFGNLVTAAGSKHHWLHEGFATYYQWLSERHLYGQAYFEWELQKAREMIFAATEQEPLPLAHPQAGSARFYQKGAWLLYMLRDFVGDDIYRKVINEYLKTHAYAVVENEDLIRLFKKHSSCDIEAFFNTWLYSDREPELKVVREEGSDLIKLELQGKIHADLSLRMRDGEGQEKVVSLKLEPGLKEYKLPSRETVFYLENRPYLLMKSRVQKTPADWKYQALAATKRLLLQYDAFKGLLTLNFKDQLIFMGAAARDSNRHFAVRELAAKRYLELISANEKAGVDFLNQLLGAQSYDYQNLQFQKSILKLALSEKLALEDSILKPLRRKGQSYELRSLALEASLKPQNPEANRWLFDSLWAREPGRVGHNVYLKTLFFRTALYGDLKAYAQLIDFAGISYDFNTRINALQYLAYLGIKDKAYLEVLFKAFFNSNWKLVKIAREQLKQIQASQTSDFEAVYRDLQSNWTDFQKRKAARTFGEL